MRDKGENIIRGCYSLSDKDFKKPLTSNLAHLYKIQAYPSSIPNKDQSIKLSENENSFFLEITNNLVKSNLGNELLKAAKHLGFKFGGDTHSASKANTNTETKIIRIRMDLGSDVATLSLAYELSNLINSGRYNGIFESAKYKEIDCSSYVDNIISLEAQANICRSKVAIDLGLERLIQNKNFIKYVYNIDDLKTVIENEGVIGKNCVPVREHYSEQFKKYYT